MVALAQQVQQLIAHLLDDTPIHYDYQNDAPDGWECVLCGNAVPAVFAPRNPHEPYKPYSFIGPIAEPCDIAAFPHTNDCPVTHARRIQSEVTT